MSKKCLKMDRSIAIVENKTNLPGGSGKKNQLEPVLKPIV